MSLTATHSVLLLNQARMYIEGKRTSLGYFKTAEEAAICYANAAKLYHENFLHMETAKLCR